MVLVRQYITFCTGVVAKLVGNFSYIVVVIILVHNNNNHSLVTGRVKRSFIWYLYFDSCQYCVLCVVCCKVFVFIYDNIINCFHRIITDINYGNIVNCFHRIITDDNKCHSLSLVSKWFQFYCQCLHLTYFWDLISRHAVVYIKIKIRLLGRIET